MEDHESLRKSIDDFDNTDQIALATRLEKHELLEMRRIAALLYKKNKRYADSIKLSKQDKIYQDCMETARDSGKPELAEELVNFFIGSGDKECFTATLFTCYALLKPDVIMELAWRNKMMDAAMPYMIQAYTARIDGLDKKTEENEKEKEKQKSANNDFVADMGMGVGMAGGFGHLAIGNAPYQGNPMGMGQPNGMMGNPMGMGMQL